MKLSFEYNKKNIDFEVEFRKRKTLSIEIKPPGEVKVIAPNRTSKNKILEIVNSKAGWITEKSAEVSKIQITENKKEFKAGEGFLYLGRSYPLELDIDENIKKTTAVFSKEKFVVKTNVQDKEIIKDAVEILYRKLALKVVLERVEYYKSLVNKEPRNVKAKEQKRRWGSCTSRGDIYINWKCVMAPIEQIDYIVVHEMCHLIYMNHSKEFWREVKRVLPDYENRKEALKYEGNKYIF